MIERIINWQHALRFLDHAQSIGWEPVRLPAQELDYTALIRFNPRLPVFDIRDWIHESVGGNYKLTAIYESDPSSMTISLPSMLRFVFFDIETSTLFKLRWL